MYGRITYTDFVEIQWTATQITKSEDTKSQRKNVETTWVPNNVQLSQPHIINALEDAVPSCSHAHAESTIAR